MFSWPVNGILTCREPLRLRERRLPPLPPQRAEGACGLQGFNYAKTTKAQDKADLGCHFFIDDYQFERLWQRPGAYLDVLRPYQCVLTPDFEAGERRDTAV